MNEQLFEAGFSLSSFYRWELCDTEKLNSLPKIIKQVSECAGFNTGLKLQPKFLTIMLCHVFLALTIAYNVFT